jgi:hypothetical protein
MSGARGISIRAVKRRLRAARRAVSLLDQELMALADDLPCPSEEDLGTMLNFEAPLTLEASLLGLVKLGHFYLAEAAETLTLALSTTPRRLNSSWRRRWIRPDLRQSLTNVLAGRSHKDPTPPPTDAS